MNLTMIRKGPLDPLVSAEKHARQAVPALGDYIDELIAKAKEERENRKAAEDWVTSDGKPVGSKAPAEEFSLKILRVLAYGYEPTSLPTHWYAGALPDAKPERDMFGRPRAQEETWGNQFLAENKKQRAEVQRLYGANASMMGFGVAGVATFTAPMPRAAFDAYQKARDVFGPANLRIYSPDRAHFQQNTLRAIDPVIIGKVDGPEPRYFEVYRWDIAEDIAHAVNKVMK